MGTDRWQLMHCQATWVEVGQVMVAVDHRVGEETTLAEVIHQVTLPTLDVQAFRFSRFPNRGVDHLGLREVTAIRTEVMILTMMTMN